MMDCGAIRKGVKTAKVLTNPNIYSGKCKRGNFLTRSLREAVVKKKECLGRPRKQSMQGSKQAMSR